ncbi:MAG: metalloregulator ArsR/SmtB family transcription factor [Actinomycetota bacterium]|nr:metalloregulator ArsR/SmtB family transcription factor [Actinomycetota bacterium]
MVELVTPNEKVRDLTAAPRHIPIHMEGSAAYEVILTLWTTFEPHQNNTSHYLGKKFHEKVRAMTSPELTDEITSLSGPYCSIWLGVAGLLKTAPSPHEPERMFEWLGDMSPKRLRRWLLGYVSHADSSSLIEQAANGDTDALRELICKEEDCEDGEEIVSFFEIPDEELPKRLATTLATFYQDVFLKLDVDFAGSIERAAAARRAVVSSDDAKAVVEEVTQGIDYEIPLGVSRVVLVPSMVIKPLSVIDQHRDTLVVYYGMADEFIDSDPEAPPSWLVNTYKALSDERRLRILRRLSEGDTSLEELTEMLGLSKSTVHHHISILRSAGLIRIHVPSEKGQKQRIYSLRDNALGDATGFLDSYLSPSQPEVEHA